jgi:hypothetical protein
VGKIEIIARLGRVIDHAIDKFVELILETRKGYNQYAFMYTPSGDNSVPLKEDRVVIVKIDGTGRFISAGVLVESQGAKPGEKIFFAREAKGNIVSKLSMLNDGSVTLDTDTETTGDATGAYNRTIKGLTTILEKDDHNYTNEKNVNETIKENKTMSIEGDETREVSGDRTKNIGGDENIGVDGSKTENIGGDSEETVVAKKGLSVGGDYIMDITGNLKITAGGTVTINGSTINLN